MTDPLKDFDREPGGDLFDVTARLKLPRNDVGNARRLVAVHGGEIRFVPGKGWGVWDGRVWDFRHGETAAMSRAADLQRILEEEAAASSRRPVPEAEIDALATAKGMTPEEAEKAIRADRKRALAAFATTCGNVSRMRAALDVMRHDVRAEVRELDAEPLRITAANGELDLSALAVEAPEAEDDEERVARWRAALRPFRRESMATRMMGAAFDPAADCPGFKAFLERALPDPEMRSFARRLAGYMLSGRNEAQIALILLGSGGNGKSTFVNALAHVLGDYAATCPISMFLENRHVNSGAATPEEALLPGARVYLASEPEMGAVLSTSKIKGLTGGEPRQSRALNRDPFVWVPHGLPVLSFNRVPRITDESEGLWRRLTFLPFDVFLPGLPAGDRITPAEMERIVRKEASGVLNWMLQGWSDMHVRLEGGGLRGIDPPQEVQDIKARQRALADPVGEFLKDVLVEDAGGRIQATELHRVYEAWCEANGAAPLTVTRFKRALVDKGYRSVKSHGRMQWVGLTFGLSEDVQELLRKAGEPREDGR